MSLLRLVLLDDELRHIEIKIIGHIANKVFHSHEVLLHLLVSGLQLLLVRLDILLGVLPHLLGELKLSILLFGEL